MNGINASRLLTIHRDPEKTFREWDRDEWDDIYDMARGRARELGATSWKVKRPQGDGPVELVLCQARREVGREVIAEVRDAVLRRA